MDSSITRPLILASALPFPIAHIVLGLVNLDRLTTVFPTLAAMVLCLLAIVLLLRSPDDGRLGAVPAGIVLTCTSAMTILVNVVLPAGEHPGYAAWHSGALQMLLVATALRRRSGYAWVGIGLFALIQAVGSTLNGMTPIDTLVLIITPVTWIVVATAVNSIFDRSQRQIDAASAREREAAGQLAREHARQVARTHWAADLDRRTRPALERIAAQDIDAAARDEFLLLEAELRDAIRGRALMGPGVAAAARQARTRGVRVDLLDDLKSELEPALAAAVTGQLVVALERTGSGVLTARAWPAGSRPEVTILTYDEAEADAETYLEISSNPEPRPL